MQSEYVQHDARLSGCLPADAYELQGGRFSGQAAVIAEGREVQAPGRLVTAKFYVDAENLVAERTFYRSASHATYMPGQAKPICSPFYTDDEKHIVVPLSKLHTL